MIAAFDQFCQACSEALNTQKGPEGRQMVQQNLETLLSDPEFVAAECGPNAEPGIRTLYRDKETGYNTDATAFSLFFPLTCCLSQHR